MSPPDGRDGEARSANLPTAGLTQKQAAALMNVSVRSVGMAARLMRIRPDLAAECEAGRLTLQAALRQAEGRSPPTKWDRLVRAWNAASPEDRERMIEAITSATGASR